MESRQINPGADRGFKNRSRQQINVYDLPAVELLFDDGRLSLITANDGRRLARLVHGHCVRHRGLQPGHIVARSGVAAIHPDAARHTGQSIGHCALRHRAMVEDHREAGIGQEEEHQKKATEAENMFVEESHGSWHK